MSSYTVIYNAITGQPLIQRDDGAFIPAVVGNAAFAAFLAWNAQQIPPLDYATLGPKTAKKVRTLFAIRADLVALTAGQKANIWDALMGGSPPLWSQNAGSNASALAVLQMLGASGTLSASDVLEAKVRAVAMYVQDNPTWLINPAFDPTINVPGDQLVV